LGEVIGALRETPFVPTVIESVILGEFAGNILGIPAFPKATIKTLLLGGPQTAPPALS